VQHVVTPHPSFGESANPFQVCVIWPFAATTFLFPNVVALFNKKKMHDMVCMNAI
jgi:hypothetical protein